MPAAPTAGFSLPLDLLILAFDPCLQILSFDPDGAAFSNHLQSLCGDSFINEASGIPSCFDNLGDAVKKPPHCLDLHDCLLTVWTSVDSRGTITLIVNEHVERVNGSLGLIK